MKTRFITVLMLIWLTVVTASLLWNWWQVDHAVHELALKEAKTSFDKDLLMRRWGAMHGGVYVRPTESYPPNPYLRFLEERDVVTRDGMRLTLVNPAYMVRQLYELAAKQEGVQGRITSLKPINPLNKPTAWERAALLEFESGSREKMEMVQEAGVSWLRYIRAMITEKPCLKCHEDQGYKEGDIRGGMVVSVPLAPYLQVAARQQQVLLVGHVAIASLGLWGLWASGRRLQRSENAVLQAKSEAEHLAEMENLLLSSLGEGVYGVDTAGQCIFINPAALAMLGLTQEQVVGHNPHQLFHAHRVEGVEYPLEECPVYLTLQDGQQRARRDTFERQGGLFPVQMQVTPMWRNGSSIGAVVVFNDLSQQEQTELEYRAILQTATDGYLLVAADGRIIGDQ